MNSKTAIDLKEKQAKGRLSLLFLSTLVPHAILLGLCAIDYDKWGALVVLFGGGIWLGSILILFLPGRMLWRKHLINLRVGEYDKNHIRTISFALIAAWLLFELFTIVYLLTATKFL